MFGSLAESERMLGEEREREWCVAAGVEGRGGLAAASAAAQVGRTDERRKQERMKSVKAAAAGDDSSRRRGRLALSCTSRY